MYFKFNKYNLFYEKYGNSNKNILILPGWGDTRKTFDKMISYLKKEYTIYIIDYPGFGNSPIINKELTIYDYALIINSLIKENNLSNLSIIAHSFGGRVISILLSDYKLKINKLILIDVAGIKRLKPLIFIKQKIYKFLKTITKLLPKKQRYNIHKKLFSKFSSSDYKVLPPNMYQTFKNVIKTDLRKKYKKITSNTLIIWGKKDIDTPLKDAKYINKKIKNSKLIIYKNSSHYSYLENSKEINKNIYDFLNY